MMAFAGAGVSQTDRTATRTSQYARMSPAYARSLGRIVPLRGAGRGR
jgi:hypothetical protein